MIVLIDVGNTRAKLGWWDARLGRETQVQALTLQAEGQALASTFHDWLGQLPISPVMAYGVSVAGSDVNAALENTLMRAKIPIQWIRPTAEVLGLTNRYDQPSQLGADRWASMLGVAGKYPQNATPIILSTFGTATTIDTLGPGAVFEGGMILPGPALMRSSLAKGTARLPYVQGHGVAFPRNTQQAISTGVLSAQAGAVLRQCIEVKESFGVTPHVCASGGAWPEVEQEVRKNLASIQVEVEHIAYPALDGLARLAAAGFAQASQDSSPAA
jgi:type III pantothenate kinase